MKPRHFLTLMDLSAAELKRLLARAIEMKAMHQRGERNKLVPPNCAMPTWNDTRVRVDDFSKIIAMVLPASGVYFLPRFCMAFNSLARASKRLSSLAFRSINVKK